MSYKPALDIIENKRAVSDELKENQRIFNAQEIAFIRKIVKDEILKASADALAVQFCGERKS